LTSVFCGCDTGKRVIGIPILYEENNDPSRCQEIFISQDIPSRYHGGKGQDSQAESGAYFRDGCG
jgi:hypothetical protein